MFEQILMSRRNAQGSKQQTRRKETPRTTVKRTLSLTLSHQRPANASGASCLMPRSQTVIQTFRSKRPGKGKCTSENYVGSTEQFKILSGKLF